MPAENINEDDASEDGESIVSKEQVLVRRSLDAYVALRMLVHAKVHNLIVVVEDGVETS